MPPALAVQNYVSALTSNRFLLYSIVSIVGVVTVIANALRIHSNFYALTIHLAKSNGTVIVLTNFLVLLAIFAARFWQGVFFGELRTMEVERLYDRIWFFVTESLLAFTIFRDDFDVPFALMFGMLLFSKCFHWLLSDRIEWMDQRPYPGPPLIFHIRINALIVILWLADVITYIFILDNLLSNGFSGTILFASEYAILTATLMNSAAKYAISIIDLRRASNRGGENAPPWEDKSMWVFYVELATDFMKLVTYLIFFMVVFAFYGIPLHIIRDVYITARSFYMRFRDLMRYRTATRNMDERYPNATTEELANMNDRTCIICREEMISPDPTTASGQNPSTPTTTNAAAAAHPEGPNTTPKRLPCGHVFHFYCLRSWLERQQSCPTCRRSVLEENQPANGAARVPAPPQPGAVPQMQNAAQQQRNVGGLVGRVLGMARMAPIIPGQFANGLLPPQAQQQPQFVNQQNFNLQIPQQQPAGAPGGQGVAWDAVVPPVDRVPEQYGGFWGPDGDWQPWPNYPLQPMDEGRTEGAQTPAETGAPTIPTAASSSGEPSVPDVVNAGTSDPAVSAGTSTQSEGATGSTSAVSARQAAALAAMRRSQSTGTVNARTRTSDNTISATSTADPGSSSSSNNITAGGSSTTTENQPSATPSPSNQKSSSSTSSLLPRYIPLYDTTIPTIRLSPAGDSQREQAAASRRSQIRTRVLDYMASHPGSSIGGSSPSSFVNSAFRSGELPEQLTDVQLAALDSLTREAIDERLRILESVSARTTLCVEELLRARSVLPAPARRRDGQEVVGVASEANGSANHTASPTVTLGAPEAQAEVPPVL
ncbi:hypothetical protein SCHPADRAFT_899780 [Schizopora paradoxa]|uniref:RING-type E3 ubiquitin transferase n=1 Tax=Schizopora paradoxa TaxID=27342 RepID=A0A0H2S346_9AGAM|nr:hypothetical protein SCHPADRAFT_899780 [Schizopora paradoxa]